MSDINLSKAVRSNLLSLQNTANLMAKTQGRLATGLKVNSALDNPTNFFTASSLNSRAGDINQLLDSMANGIQTIEAADNGLTAITKTLESMQSTLRQARQDKSFQTASLSLDAETINGGTAGTRQLNFSGGAIGETGVAIDLTKADNGSVRGDTYTAPAASTGADAIEGTVAWGATRDLSTAMAITVQGNNDDAAITLNLAGASAEQADAVTIDEALAELNGQLTTAGSSIEAYATEDGEIGFRDTDAANTGADASITITASADTVTLGLTTDGTTDAETTGAAAGTAVIEVAGTEVTLNGDAHGTAEQAAAAINAALAADPNAAAGVSASAVDGALRITGADDGTGVTLGGTDADAVFGAEAARNETPPTAAGDSAGVAKTVQELVNEINGNSELKGLIRASNDNGALRIENLSTQILDIDGVSSTGAIDGTSDGASEIGGNSVRADLANQFRELRDQLDKLADDASFNGINLLRGDNLQITFNETGTSELNIRSKDEQGINSSVLNIEPDLQAEALDSDANIDDLLADVKSAINDVRSQSSAFGSSLSIVQNRQDFSKNMINTLQTGAANLTLADTNEEAANLLALQTRQQLSSTALSMASQADQAVLRLF